MELTQKEKAEALEQAVINCSAEELSKIYDKLGYVEMSAPALGLACRFRGLDIVKILVEKGATFDFPLTEETENNISLLYWAKVCKLSHKLLIVSAESVSRRIKGCLLSQRHEIHKKRKAGSGKIAVVSCG